MIKCLFSASIQKVKTLSLKPKKQKKEWKGHWKKEKQERLIDSQARMI